MKKAFFTYHGAEDSYPELFARTNQIVEVIRPLTEKEADINDIGPMYEIKFSDGLIHDAFEDELDFKF